MGRVFDSRSMLREVQKHANEAPTSAPVQSWSRRFGEFLSDCCASTQPPPLVSETFIYRAAPCVLPSVANTRAGETLPGSLSVVVERAEGVCVHTDDGSFQLTYSGNILYSIARDGGSTVNTSSDFFQFSNSGRLIRSVLVQLDRSQCVF